MDPWTGEILAMANLPDFDPNRFWKYDDAHRRDRAVMDAYEPGSTYKLITAAAALESRKVTLASRFPAHDRASRSAGRRSTTRKTASWPERAAARRSSRSSSTRTTSARPKLASQSAQSTLYAMERKAGFGDADRGRITG